MMEVCLGSRIGLALHARWKWEEHNMSSNPFDPDEEPDSWWQWEVSEEYDDEDEYPPENMPDDEWNSSYD
jgi:hypothetical protein